MQKSTDTDIKLLHQFIPAGIFFMYSVHYQLSSVKAEKKERGGGSTHQNLIWFSGSTFLILDLLRCFFTQSENIWQTMKLVLNEEKKMELLGHLKHHLYFSKRPSCQCFRKNSIKTERFSTL